MKKKKLCTRHDTEYIAAFVCSYGRIRAAKKIGITDRTLRTWCKKNPQISVLVEKLTRKITEQAYEDIMENLKMRGREDLEQVRQALLALAIGESEQTKTKEVHKNGSWQEVSRQVIKGIPRLSAIVTYVRLFGDSELRQYADKPKQPINTSQEQGFSFSEREQAILEQMKKEEM